MLRGERADGFDGALDDRGGGHAIHLQGDFPALEALEIENVVDQRDQAHGVAFGHPDQLAGVSRQVAHRATGEQAQRAANRGERRAQLMAHGRHELLFQAIDLATLRDIMNAAGELPAPGRVELEEGQLHRKDLAVLAAGLPFGDPPDGAAKRVAQEGRGLIRRHRYEQSQVLADELVARVAKNPLGRRIDRFDHASPIHGKQSAQHIVDDRLGPSLAHARPPQQIA